MYIRMVALSAALTFGLATGALAGGGGGGGGGGAGDRDAFLDPFPEDPIEEEIDDIGAELDPREPELTEEEWKEWAQRRNRMDNSLMDAHMGDAANQMQSW